MCCLFCIYLHNKCGRLYGREEWSALTYIDLRLGSSSISDLIRQHLVKLLHFLSWLLPFEMMFHDLLYMSLLFQTSVAQVIFFLLEMVGFCSALWSFHRIGRKGFWLITCRSHFLSQVAVPSIWNSVLFLHELLSSLGQRGKAAELWLLSLLSQNRSLYCMGRRTDACLLLDSSCLFNPFWWKLLA